MLRSAYAVVFLFDAESGARGDEMRFIERLGHKHLILAVNKMDVGKKKPLMPALPISAKTGEGLDELRRKILNSLEIGPPPPPGSPVVFTERQRKLLELGDREAIFH